MTDPSLDKNTVGGSVLLRGCCGRGECTRGMISGAPDAVGEEGSSLRSNRSMAVEASSTIVFSIVTEPARVRDTCQRLIPRRGRV